MSVEKQVPKFRKTKLLKVVKREMNPGTPRLDGFRTMDQEEEPSMNDEENSGSCHLCKIMRGVVFSGERLAKEGRKKIQFKVERIAILNLCESTSPETTRVARIPDSRRSGAALTATKTKLSNLFVKSFILRSTLNEN